MFEGNFKADVKSGKGILRNERNDLYDGNW
jgi:hypothetical protein